MAERAGKRAEVLVVGYAGILDRAQPAGFNPMQGETVKDNLQQVVSCHPAAIYNNYDAHLAYPIQRTFKQAYMGLKIT